MVTIGIFNHYLSAEMSETWLYSNKLPRPKGRVLAALQLTRFAVRLRFTMPFGHRTFGRGKRRGMYPRRDNDIAASCLCARSKFLLRQANMIPSTDLVPQF